MPMSSSLTGLWRHCSASSRQGVTPGFRLVCRAWADRAIGAERWLEREALLRHGFDPSFLSGEDIELRRRLRGAGAKLGVSRETLVLHRFDDGFAFARDQWLADGRGLKRVFDKEGWRGLLLLALPLAAAIRGLLLSVGRLQFQWLPYYGCYLVFNYAGMLGRTC